MNYDIFLFNYALPYKFIHISNYIIYLHYLNKNIRTYAIIFVRARIVSLPQSRESRYQQNCQNKIILVHQI